MNVKIEQSWRELLQSEFDKPYFGELVEFIRNEYATRTVYPPARLIFNAFDSCPVDDVKVVIIGQDPYHGAGQAHGLCFSVNDGVQFPPSLRHIFKEISNEYGCEAPLSGNLQRWADQGVFLLNATLTVREGEAGSHQRHGWEQFTDAVIEALASRRSNVVYMLWGAYAISKSKLIDKERNMVLTSPHPSPLSAHRGFFGNGHFKKANDYLESHGIAPVKW